MTWFPALLSSAAAQGGQQSATDSAVSTNTDTNTQQAADIAALTQNLATSQENLTTALAQIAGLQQQLDDATGINLTAEEERRLRNDFVLLPQNNNDHVELLGYLGKQFGYPENSAYINRPTSLQRDGNDIFVGQYYRHPVLVADGAWTLTRQLPITYQNPTASNEGIAYSYGARLDRANNRVAVCSWARHIVRVYALDTGDLLYEIGVPSGAGHVSAGKVYYPAMPVWLPTGNLAIVSYYGYGSDNNGGNLGNHGHISEYDGSTGAFIATRQGFINGGQPETGGMYRPIDMFMNDDGTAWVSVYGRAKLAKVDTTTTDANGFWSVVDVIVSPPGESIAEPWGICPTSDGMIAVAGRNKGKLFVIDPATKEAVHVFDLKAAGLPGDPRRIVELSPGIFAIADWSANYVYVIKADGVIIAKYEPRTLADGWTDQATDEGFDPDSGDYTLPWRQGLVFPDHVKHCMRLV